eukprot:1280354-Amorphochlora_amoeboformis.AAC.1
MQSPHPLRIRRSLLLFPSAQHVNVTAPDEKKVISKSSSRLSRVFIPQNFVPFYTLTLQPPTLL